MLNLVTWPALAALLLLPLGVSGCQNCEDRSDVPPAAPPADTSFVVPRRPLKKMPGRHLQFNVADAQPAPAAGAVDGGHGGGS